MCCCLIILNHSEQVFSKEMGKAYKPEDHEAFDRVSQKIRDIKKYRLKSANNANAPRKVSQKRTSKSHVDE